MRASWFESKEKITLWHNPGYRGADIPDEFTNRSADKDIPLSQLYGFESTDKLNAKEHGDQVLSIAVKMKANMWNGDPIVVTRTTDGYMILDGHHRFAAAKKAGLESLPAIVVDASELEHRNDIPKAKVEEASGYIPTKAQAKDPRFSSALTVDVKPGETQRQAAKLGMKIDKKGSPPLLHATAAKNTSANKSYNLGLVESLQAKYDAVKSSNVNEAFDNPYTYRWDKQLEDHWVAKADTPAGLMLVMAEWGESDSSWTIDFAVGGRMGKSGAGDEFRIFATVVAVLKDWITKVDLSNTKLISFSADKSSDVGASRAKLYARFARQMASQLGWKLDVTSTDDGREQNEHFKMFNPNFSVTEEVEVSLHGDAKKGYVLSKIEVSGDERNAGQGTKAMQDIVDRMDREGAIIALTPDDAFGGNKNRLIKFYKRFGFVPNKGRNKDFRFRETMIRYPKTNESVNEGYKLQLERDADMMVLNITDTETGKRTEVRGKPGYETGNYDANDKLHQLLDRIGKASNISDLINGEVVGINPKHPDGKSAKTATDTAFNEDVNIDNKEGWGAVSNNQEVDYFGMRVKMKPSVFLKLAESRRGVPAVDKVVDHIKNGGAIGAPFLIISYTQGSPAEIIGHEGRSRMIAIQQVFGDIPVEVHLFFNSDTVNRARHLTPDIVADINKTMMSQDDQELSGPFFTESINEKITKRTPMGDVIDDFYQSDAPQFKGKSKAKRRQMAIAAKLAKMDENFADGKVKGKSKPGRVKAAGASCNGSVTDLRARAKKYSGERAKMYHWCANMKSGKKK